MNEDQIAPCAPAAPLPFSLTVEEATRLSGPTKTDIYNLLAYTVCGEDRTPVDFTRCADGEAIFWPFVRERSVSLVSKEGVG